MSLSALKDGALQTLVNGGHWTSTEVSGCDFGIATRSASAVILQPGPNSNFRRLSMGDPTDKYQIWNIAGIVMIKRPSDSTQLLNMVWQACDDIYDTFDGDDTLNGAACTALVTQISRPSIDSFISDGATDWAWVEFIIQAEEY